MNLWFRGILQTFIFFKYIFSFCSNKEKGSKTTLIANLAPKFDQKHVPVISIPVLYFIGSWINYTKIVHGMLMTTFKWVSSTPFGFPFRLPVRVANWTRTELTSSKCCWTDHFTNISNCFDRLLFACNHTVNGYTPYWSLHDFWKIK